MAVTAEILNKFFPVGTIYESTSSTSPAAEFGGTWTQIKGRFLVAAGSNGKSGDELLNLTAGGTGGTSTHTITTAEMPQHNHSFSTATLTGGFFNIRTGGASTEGMAAGNSNSTVNIRSGGTNTTTYPVYHTRYGTGYSNTDVLKVSPTITATVGSNGSGSSYNTLPPYLAVYMWQRTA